MKLDPLLLMLAGKRIVSANHPSTVCICWEDKGDPQEQFIPAKVEHGEVPSGGASPFPLATEGALTYTGLYLPSGVLRSLAALSSEFAAFTC